MSIFRFSIWCLDGSICGNLVFISFIMFYKEGQYSVVVGVSEGVGARASAMGAITKPPVPKKVSHVLETHGDKREDSYYWIRDDERKNPEMLAYLEEENNYTEAVMAGEIYDILELHFLNLFCTYLSGDFHCSLVLLA